MSARHPSRMTDTHPKQRLNRLVALVDDLTVWPGLILNKPPFRMSVVGSRACHNINAYRPFARSGQCTDDALADDAPYLTLARFYGQKYRHIAGAERRPVRHKVIVPSGCWRGRSAACSARKAQAGR